MKEQDNYYKAPFGGGTLFMMFFSFFLLIIMIFVNLCISPLWAVITIIAMILAMFGFIFVPKGYRITEEGIIIERVGTDIRIPLNEIAIIDYSRGIWWPHLNWLCGGFFGYAGTIYKSGYGAMKMYSKRISRMVLITTVFRNYFLIAPEHPEKFVEEVEKLMAEYQYLDSAEIDEAEIADEEQFAEVLDY